jgi:hypothetical protein
MTPDRFGNAWREYKPLYIAAMIYVLAILGETVIFAVPFDQFMRVGWAMLLVTFKCLLLLAAMAGWVFMHRFVMAKGSFEERGDNAKAHFQTTARAYVKSELFAYACVGLPILYAINFFFIQKSLIAFANPYSWDPVFAAWDKLLHFGRYPHEWVIPAADSLNLHISTYFDLVYYVWFVILYIGLSFNLFLDRQRHRRLRFYWVFFLSWAIIGSLMALGFSSVGPLFYHDFYPVLANPYAGLVAHFTEHGPKDFPIANYSRSLLLHWASNGKMVNVNALSAMPSLHVAIAWLMVLYAWQIGRAWFTAALAFCVSIFLASVYFGFHYAVDGYVSVATVSLLWWGVGRALDRQYPPDTKPLIHL